MDVLEYRSPNLAWKNFRRGGVSEEMWRKFQELVQLCHAYSYWAQDAQQKRMTPLPRLMDDDSRSMRSKRKRQRQGDIDESETHMHRAAYLADSKITEMLGLVRDEHSADGKLAFSLRRSIGPLRISQERERCRIGAFNEFDAAVELNDPLETIIRRWSDKAGFK